MHALQWLFQSFLEQYDVMLPTSRKGKSALGGEANGNEKKQILSVYLLIREANEREKKSKYYLYA